MSKYSIIKIIPYFGQWPEWIDLYIESCKANSDIDWLFFTDCGEPANRAKNVRYIHTSFTDYKKMVSEKLNINFNPSSPYKLCDLKPAYGFIHQQDIVGYDFYAFGDNDIIYGNIRHFITDKILDNYDVISTHDKRISGHFAFFKNNDKQRNAFRQIPNWQKYLEDNNHFGLDESKFSKVFIKHKKHPLLLRKLWALFNPYQRKVLFKEQFSTILSPHPWWSGSMTHPQNWFWIKGKLTNDLDGNREFMYLHFMNWKSNKWLPKPHRSTPSAWMNLESLVHINYHQAGNLGFQISPTGFYEINA
ncbi:MAG: hypothetical protein HRT92_00890 [Piscirickettsiaceae bacterium]|nr:hypothetical protein [Piscirickettsiaceae bacterium]